MHTHTHNHTQMHLTKVLYPVYIDNSYNGIVKVKLKNGQKNFQGHFIKKDIKKKKTSNQTLSIEKVHYH